MRIKHRSFKQRLTDINILLACLLFFGMSLGLVAQRGSVNNASQKILSLDNFYKSIHPLVQARGVGKIARLIHKRIEDKMLGEVLKGIIENEKSELTKDWPLTRNDKLLLLIALAELYKGDPYKQDQILNFIARYSELFSKGEPLLYITAYLEGFSKKVLEQEIPLLLKWIQRTRGEVPFIAEGVKRALLYAVEVNDLDTLKNMVTYGVPLDKELATQMVWNVVEGRKNPDFIVELKKADADFNKPKGSYTPLMKALLNKSKSMVEQLLQAGADPNLMIDNAVGAPLQIILSEGIRAKEDKRMDDVRLYNQLDEMLRNYGARE